MTNKDVIFINSYSRTGIGDFGDLIKRELTGKKGINIVCLETSINWASFFSLWRRIQKSKSSIILNIGFTSFGKSPLRNFLNFVLIGFSSFMLRRKFNIILHDSPDIISQRDSGYHFFRLMKAGGKIATFFSLRSNIYVFSYLLYEKLKQNYKVSSIMYFPFPCSNLPDVREIDRQKRQMILTIGYIAPYKGLEALVDLKKKTHDIDIYVVGSDHRMLSSGPEGRDYFTHLRRDLEDSNIFMPGYLDNDQIEDLLTRFNVVGILPYKYTSGSSFSAAYMVERGLPLVTTDLPEFKKLQEMGMGIICSPRSIEELKKGINLLLSDEELYATMSKNNQTYCKKFSISNFVNVLLEGV